MQRPAAAHAVMPRWTRTLHGYLNSGHQSLSINIARLHIPRPHLRLELLGSHPNTELWISFPKQSSRLIISKVLALKAIGPVFNAQNPYKQPGVVAHASMCSVLLSRD